MVVYSNIHAFPLHQVEELDTNSALFGLKPIKKDTDQYVYIENQSKKSEHLKVSFRTHQGQLSDGVNVIDFIENYGNHSHNNYTYTNSFHDNIQVNVRVFSPRDPKGLPLALSVKGKQNEQDQLKEIRLLKFDPIDF
jgi:hypothetical protein